MKKHVGKILIVLSMFVFASFSPVMSYFSSIAEDSPVPSEVKIGSEVTVAMIDIEHSGITKKASSCIVHTPSGATIKSNRVLFSEAGKYIFEFSALFGEETITKNVETISIRTPSSMFLGSNASISEGSFAYNDKLDASIGVSDYKGIKVNSRDGGTVTFNKILDFSNASKISPFIDFIVEPSTLGAFDAGEIVITLTDADDPNNKVDIKYVDGLAGSGGAMRLTYASARATGQYYAGYEVLNGSGHWHINNDQTGTPTFLTLRGLDEQIISDFGVGYLNSQLFFDYSTKQILVKSEYCAVNNVALIDDLDSIEVYPTNPWSGFKNNRAILSITTKDVSGGGTKYIIKSIFGYDFSKELLRDLEAPILNIDYKGNDKNNLPLAKKGNTYPIFACDAFDNFDDDLVLRTNVQFFDSANATYIDIANDGERFTTYYYGDYKVSYYGRDRSGNEVENFYIVKCSPFVEDLDIVIPEDLSFYRAFDKVILPSLSEIEIKNAQGNARVYRNLISVDGTVTRLTKDFFIPTTIGLYKVEYVVEDIYEKPVSKIVDYNIHNIEQPVIVDYINLPPVMVKNQYYEIPRIQCKCPEGDAIVDKEVDIYINDTLFEDDKLFVSSLDKITIDYVPRFPLADKKTFEIDVVDGVDENGKTIKNNYFYSDDDSYTAESITNKALQFTINSEAKINFIKTISANDLSLSFGLDEKTIFNYDSFDINIQDKADLNKSLTLKVKPNGNGLKLYIPFDKIPKELESDSNKQFEIYYRPFNKVLRDRNYRDICQIKYFDSGEPFTGFSDEVSVSFGFSNLTNPSDVSLIFINNQSFKTSITKDNAGPQIITDSNLNWANELGEEITISKASAFDVLSYVKYLYVSVTDGNGHKILNKVDASIDHKITLNQYGSYRIEYISEDGNDRTSNRSFTICCIENEKPTLSVDLSPKDSYSVGTIFHLPTYSFNDNSRNCTLDISLYLPNGQGIAIEHDVMVDGEVRKENYLDLDHYSNELVNDNNSIKLYIAGKFILRYLVIDAYGNVTYQEFVLNVKGN